MTGSLLESGTLLAGQRTEYRLGDKLAEGGEGIVYRVQQRPELVAKVYREFDFSREAKLAHLVGAGTKRLHRVAAWPLSVLKDPEDQAVGFVMQHLNRWQPLHSVYQTKIRLQNHPNRTYAFLVRVARNLSACVHHVHEADFVIGDLNESNVLVDDQAMAKLIDTDSFQVRVEGRLYHCKVGKSELLPPELQRKSLDGIERTQNQDRFGLAVLLFQTLVFGRHPFAGKPRDNCERTLEDCISNGYYAFTQKREIPLDPPPYVTLDWLPPEICELFEQAFDPEAPERPSPHDWYLALKKLETELKECGNSVTHRYWNGCEKCPWCALEERWGLTLFRSGMDFGTLDVDADALWNAIEPLENQLALPEEIQFVSHKMVPPAEISKSQRFLLNLFRPGFSTMWVYFLLFRTLSRETAFFLFLILAVTFFMMVPNLFLGLLRRTVRASEKRLEKLQQAYKAEASPERILQRLDDLRKMRNTLASFGAHVHETREALVREKHRPKLDAYLRKYSLLGADIGPVGREKLTMLHDAGYVTAEDVDEQKLRHQKTKNPELVKYLLAWRASLEAQFWSTSEYTLTPLEEHKMMANLRREASEMRTALQEAPDDLRELEKTVAENHEEIAKEARPDLEVVRTKGAKLLAYEQLLYPSRNR